MSASIEDLPVEQAEAIYKLCDTRDLISLASCSSQLHYSLKRSIWREVNTHWSVIGHEKFNTRNLYDLGYASVLRISPYTGLTKVLRWSGVAIKFGYLLQNCNPERLLHVEITGILTDAALEMLCTRLPNLQYLHIKQCRDITASGWLHLCKLSDLTTLLIDKCRVMDVDMEKIIRGAKFNKFKLVRCVRITDKIFDCFDENLVNLTELEIGITKKDCLETLTYRNLIHTPNLREIILVGTRIDDSAMEAIAALKKLTRLELGFKTNLISGRALFDVCTNLLKLEKLRLPHCNHILDTEFYPLENLIFLKELDLNRCNQLSTKALLVISKLPSLTYLDVHSCVGVTDEGLHLLFNLKTLKFLNVYDSMKITTNSMCGIDKLKQLEVLHCGGTYGPSEAALECLFKLSALRHLDVQACMYFNDNNISSLYKLKSLVHLNLTTCYTVTNVGISHLKTLHCLVHLNMCLLQLVTDDGFFHISEFPCLCELRISRSSKLTDHAVRYISEIKALRWLEMTCCDNITDLGVSYLDKCLLLRDVNFDRCDKITIDGVLGLCKLPCVKRVGFMTVMYNEFYKFHPYPHIYFYKVEDKLYM